MIFLMVKYLTYSCSGVYFLIKINSVYLRFRQEWASQTATFQKSCFLSKHPKYSYEFIREVIF